MTATTHKPLHVDAIVIGAGFSGLRMLYEMYLQLQGKAGPRQLKDPRIGMTHNLGGTGVACTVNILGRD